MDTWGGSGFYDCAQMFNNEFKSVFYKNDLSFGVALMNLYIPPLYFFLLFPFSYTVFLRDFPSLPASAV
jgi:hypothetical protein